MRLGSIYTGPGEGGRPGGPRAWWLGSTTAGSFVNSGWAKAALPPPQQCLSVQRPETHYLVLSPHPRYSGQGGSLPLPTLKETPPGIWGQRDRVSSSQKNETYTGSPNPLVPASELLLVCPPGPCERCGGKATEPPWEGQSAESLRCQPQH